MRGFKLGRRSKRRVPPLGIAAAIAGLTLVVGLAACGGGERKASLNAGEAGQIVTSPEQLTPEQAAQIQDFYTPGRVSQATNNPVGLPTLPKDAAPGDPPQPQGGEVTVDPASPTAPVQPVGGKTGGGEQPPSAGGQGFSVESLAEAADPFRTNGKILITFKGGQMGSCSGTLVNAPNQSLVVTAGHCVYDHQHGLGWGTKFVFVPGFRDGKEPYGEWPAQFTATTDAWIGSGNFNFDFAIMSLFRTSKNVPLQAQIGARAISFNYNAQQPWGIIGYPAVSPYTGGRLLGCATQYGGSVAAGSAGPNNIQAPCDFTEGSSGGGWMMGGTSGGALGSVTSTKASSGQVIDGPYLGDEALKLYNSQKDRQTSAAAPSPACLAYKKALLALKKAKAKLKASPSPAAKRAVAKASKAVKKAKKKAKNC